MKVTKDCKLCAAGTSGLETRGASLLEKSSANISMDDSSDSATAPTFSNQADSRNLSSTPSKAFELHGSQELLDGSASSNDDESEQPSPVAVKAERAPKSPRAIAPNERRSMDCQFNGRQTEQHVRPSSSSSLHAADRSQAERLEPKPRDSRSMQPSGPSLNRSITIPGSDQSVMAVLVEGTGHLQPTTRPAPVNSYHALGYNQQVMAGSAHCISTLEQPCGPPLTDNINHPGTPLSEGAKPEQSIARLEQIPRPALTSSITSPNPVGSVAVEPELRPGTSDQPSGLPSHSSTAASQGITDGADDTNHSTVSDLVELLGQVGVRSPQASQLDPGHRAASLKRGGSGPHQRQLSSMASKPTATVLLHCNLERSPASGPGPPLKTAASGDCPQQASFQQAECSPWDQRRSVLPAEPSPAKLHASQLTDPCGSVDRRVPRIGDGGSELSGPALDETTGASVSMQSVISGLSDLLDQMGASCLPASKCDLSHTSSTSMARGSGSPPRQFSSGALELGPEALRTRQIPTDDGRINSDRASVIHKDSLQQDPLQISRPGSNFEQASVKSAPQPAHSSVQGGQRLRPHESSVWKASSQDANHETGGRLGAPLAGWHSSQLVSHSGSGNPGFPGWQQDGSQADDTSEGALPLAAAGLQASQQLAAMGRSMPAASTYLLCAGEHGSSGRTIPPQVTADKPYSVPRRQPASGNADGYRLSSPWGSGLMSSMRNEQQQQQQLLQQAPATPYLAKHSITDHHSQRQGSSGITRSASAASTSSAWNVGCSHYQQGLEVRTSEGADHSAVRHSATQALASEAGALLPTSAASTPELMAEGHNELLASAPASIMGALTQSYHTAVPQMHHQAHLDVPPGSSGKGGSDVISTKTHAAQAALSAMPEAYQEVLQLLAQYKACGPTAVGVTPARSSLVRPELNTARGPCSAWGDSVSSQTTESVGADIKHTSRPSDARSMHFRMDADHGCLHVEAHSRRGTLDLLGRPDHRSNDMHTNGPPADARDAHEAPVKTQGATRAPIRTRCPAPQALESWRAMQGCAGAPPSRQNMQPSQSGVQHDACTQCQASRAQKACSLPRGVGGRKDIWSRDSMKLLQMRAARSNTGLCCC